MSTPTSLKERVRLFWESEPCGSVHADADEGTKEYYDAIEQRRNELEPFLPAVADFAGAKGKTLLEIGVGIGTDFIRFVRAGAIATGVDLTQHAVDLVRKRVELEGLSATVVQADAESLPFDDDSFERVYSWGVLHHTPDTQKAVNEAIRVLAPGGTLTMMVYHRHSWVSYGLWLRRALARGKPFQSLSRILSEHMESAGTKGYTVAEARAMVAALEDVTVEPIGTSYDRSMMWAAARIAPNRLGWFLVVRGRKPR